MAGKEKYDFEIPEEGLEYTILDSSFNLTTQGFAMRSGLEKGMRVLDVGCGAGIMTAWLAKQVGPDGVVTAIDNSPEQIGLTQRRLEKLNITNVKTEVLSAYDLSKLKQKFDFIYCRFVLHHLNSPCKSLKVFHKSLEDGGIYFGEEGMVGQAFSYPPTYVWPRPPMGLKQPEEQVDGQERDPNFGARLFSECQNVGFEIQDCQIIQPVLWREDQKHMMLENLIAFKQTDLSMGTTEKQWQEKYNETQKISKDDKYLIGFYSSCQVAAIKS